MLAISRYVTSCPVLHAWDGMLSNPCIFIGLHVFTVEVPKHDMMAMSLQCHLYFIIRVPRGRFKLTNDSEFDVKLCNQKK